MQRSDLILAMLLLFGSPVLAQQKKAEIRETKVILVNADSPKGKSSESTIQILKENDGKATLETIRTVDGKTTTTTQSIKDFDEQLKKMAPEADIQVETSTDGTVKTKKRVIKIVKEKDGKDSDIRIQIPDSPEVPDKPATPETPRN